MNFSSDKLVKTGIIGAVIAVICCLLPPLAILFGFVGFFRNCWLSRFCSRTSHHYRRCDDWLWPVEKIKTVK